MIPSLGTMLVIPRFDLADLFRGSRAAANPSQQRQAAGQFLDQRDSPPPSSLTRQHGPAGHRRCNDRMRTTSRFLMRMPHIGISRHFRCDAEFRRYRGIADIDEAALSSIYEWGWTADGVGCAKGEFRCSELDRETEVQTNFLHLFGDFSQSAISRQTSGNSVDMSNRYFQNCTGSSNPIRSASKSLKLLT